VVDRQQLLSAVTTIVNVIGARAEQIGLVCDGYTFTVQGWCKRQRYGRATFPAGGVRPFDAVLPSDRLRQLLSTTEGEQLEISSTNVKGQKCIVLKNQSSRFTLSTTGEIADMPPIQEVEAVAEFTMATSELARSLMYALPLSNEDSARFAFSGVHISIGERVMFHGTDGRRLLRHCRTPLSHSGEPIAHVVPREMVRAVVTALKADKSPTVRVRMTHTVTQFFTDTLMLGAANVEGRYPNTDEIIKAAGEGFVQEIAIGNLVHMVRLGATILETDAAGMVFSVNKDSITGEIQVPSACCHVEMTDGQRHGEVRTTLDVRYLRECLSMFDPNATVRWYQKDGDSAAFFHLPDDVIYVQMPITVEG